MCSRRVDRDAFCIGLGMDMLRVAEQDDGTSTGRNI